MSSYHMRSCYCRCCSGLCTYVHVYYVYVCAVCRSVEGRKQEMRLTSILLIRRLRHCSEYEKESSLFLASTDSFTSVLCLPPITTPPSRRSWTQWRRRQTATAPPRQPAAAAMARPSSSSSSCSTPSRRRRRSSRVKPRARPRTSRPRRTSREREKLLPSAATAAGAKTATSPKRRCWTTRGETTLFERRTIAIPQLEQKITNQNFFTACATVRDKLVES